MKIEEILAQVNNAFIIDMMAELGSSVYSKGTTSSGQAYMTFKTICHGGDSSKLYYYEDTKTFYCYTNCGSMSIFDLVSKVQGYTKFSQALHYIADRLGINLSQNNGFPEEPCVKDVKESTRKIDDALEDRERRAQITPGKITKFYDDYILGYYDNNAFYQGWLDEGITPETLRKYKISFYWLEQHVIIPHYDIQGNLVGIRRRSLKEEDAKNKYMPEYLEGILYEHPLGLNLYGIYQNQKALSQRKIAFIFEGEKSVLLCDSFYGDKSVAVATCGFNVSEWQMKALRELGVKIVYLGFDKDYDIYSEESEGKNNYSRRLDTLSQRLGRMFKTYLIQDKRGLLDIKDSPVDKGKSTFEKLLEDAKEVKGKRQW